MTAHFSLLFTLNTYGHHLLHHSARNHSRKKTADLMQALRPPRGSITFPNSSLSSTFLSNCFTSIHLPSNYPNLFPRPDSTEKSAFYVPEKIGAARRGYLLRSHCLIDLSICIFAFTLCSPLLLGGMNGLHVNLRLTPMLVH